MPVPINVKKLCLLSGLLTVVILTCLVTEYATVIRWQAESWAAWNSYKISVWPGDWIEQNPLVVLWGIDGVKEAMVVTVVSWVMSYGATKFNARIRGEK